MIRKERMSMKEVMLTTIDNPFDPFTQYDEWEVFDKDMGYHSFALLDRIVKTSNELSQEEEDTAIDLAIDEIIEYNITGKYKKVYREDAESTKDKSETVEP